MLERFRQFLGLLLPAEKRRLALLMVGITIMGLVDVLGVSSILPFMAVLAKPELVISTSALGRVYEFLGFSTVNRFMFFLGVLALCAVTFSNLFSFLVSRAILRFSYALGHSLSGRLLDGYLGQPYTFFLGRNSSNLAVNVYGEVVGVIHGVVAPAMQVVARCVVTLFILILVVIVEPLLASIFVLFLGGAYGVLFRIVRHRVSALGESSQKANQTRYRLSIEAFAGIKDLRLLGHEHYYYDRINAASLEHSRHQASHQLIAMLPRYALESIAFGAMLLLVLYLLAVRKDISHALPLMALYAFTAYRLLPAFQLIFASMSQIRFNLPSFDIVSRELAFTRASGASFAANRKPGNTPTLKLMKRIVMEKVAYTYPESGQPVLNNISLNIKKNTTIGLVGMTGAGKTTLVDIILGLLTPVDGTLKIDDTVITADNVRAWQTNLGYVPQQIFLSDDTIARNIAFGVPDDVIDMARVEQAARIANLHDFITNSLPDRYFSLIGERGVKLSGGQRQRIGIARALYHDPEVLVMDEATSALDGMTEDAIIEAIRSLAHRKTIILIAHRLTTVQDCDVIYMLDEGRIVDQGTYTELIERSVSFRAMARVETSSQH